MATDWHRRLHEAQDNRNQAEAELTSLAGTDGDIEISVENWDAIKDAKKKIAQTQAHLEEVWNEQFGDQQ